MRSTGRVNMTGGQSARIIVAAVRIRGADLAGSLQAVVRGADSRRAAVILSLRVLDVRSPVK